MDQPFKISRLTPETPDSTQQALKEALQAVPGVSNVRLSPENHEFVISSEGAIRIEIMKAAFHAGFKVQDRGASQ